MDFDGKVDLWDVILWGVGERFICLFNPLCHVSNVFTTLDQLTN
jgi:hypothetical protein